MSYILRDIRTPAAYAPRPSTRTSSSSSPLPQSSIPTLLGFVMPCDSCASHKPSSRMLVLCFDGTADEFSNQNTNVVKLYTNLTKNRPAEQLTYYQAGVGTYLKPGVVSPLFNWGAKILDEAVAWYLGGHVCDGYDFLMQNYREGDKISLFGFSRGAYTARALAGFLHKIGLLSRGNTENIPFAYKLYTRTDNDDMKLSAEFKKAFCRDVKVDFVGVWDTVASVGLLGYNLPFTNTADGINIFRHALSLDEHRAKFKPNMFQVLPHDPEDKNRVLEVWFAGCHSDVGGGAVPDSEKESLSEISLNWMINQVQLSQCGILFNDEGRKLEDVVKESYSKPIHDELERRLWWWILEGIPSVKSSRQDSNGKWENVWGMNHGEGRFIQEKHPKFHASVKLRMEDTSLGYTPKAIGWEPDSVVYVD